MSDYNFDNTRGEKKNSSSFVFDNTREEKIKHTSQVFDNAREEKIDPVNSLSFTKGKQENDTIKSQSGSASTLNKSSNSKHSTNSSSASSSKQTTESKSSTETSSKVNTTSHSTTSNKSNAVSMQKNTNKISKTTEPILKNILKIDPPKDLEDLDSKKIMYFIIAFIAVIIIISSLMSFNSPGKKIPRYLSNGKYSKAVSCYNDKVSGHQNRESSIDPLFITCIDELSDTYYTDEINYDTVSKALDEFKNLSKEELSTYASNKLESINDNESYKPIFIEAEENLANKDFLSAMAIYKTIPTSFYKSNICEEQYDLCRDTLMGELPIPQTKEDYLECIDILSSYLEIVDDTGFAVKKKELETQYDNLVTDEKRQTILSNAKTAFEAKQYAEAFDILETGLADLSNDVELTKQLNSYHDLYVSEITGIVNAFLEEEDYENSLITIADAIKIYNCKSFQELMEQVYSRKENSYGTYSVEAVSFLKKSDSISSEDDVDTYTLDAQTEGIYCLTFSEMEYGFLVKVRVLNYLDEEIKHAIISNNDTLSTGSILKGEYTIEVSYRTRTGSYEFSIGQPKSILDINSYSVINDSLEYADQSNRYSFTPEYSGTYRFDFSEILYNTSLKFAVYDHLNTPVMEKRISGTSGITLDSLVAGEKYTICVNQYSGLTKYSLAIGRQKASKTVELGQKITGNIQFVDQNDLYIFKPNSTRNYTIAGSPDNWPNWHIKVYDSNNNPVDLTRDGDCRLSLSLNADTEYTISCFYHDKMTPYSFTIN